MPKSFEACVAAKGRTRTISGPSKQFGLESGQYVHVCFMPGTKKMVRGEVKTKETKKS